MTAEPTSLYRCHPQDLYDFMGWLTTRKERLVKLHPEIERGTPATPSDARDAARYKWLAYVGDSSWVPLCKRDNGPGGQLFEQYIDAAYERFRKSQGAAIEWERGA